MKKKPKIYFCEMYRARIFYFVGWDNKDVVTYLKKKHQWDIEPLDTLGACFSIEFGDDHYIAIWVREKRDVFTLAHECLHTSHFILNRIGGLLDDEPAVYLFDDIFKRAF
jgi:hypothetical protein